MCAGVIVGLALMLSITPLASADTTFADVSAGHAYFSAIEELASLGIANGYTNGDFGPGDPVTRSQFAKMIVLTMGFAVAEEDSCSFWDVPDTGSNLYPYHFIAVAANNGLTVGYGDGSFRPQAQVTRVQVITMVARAASSVLVEPPEEWQGLMDTSDPSHGTDMRWAEYGGLVDGIGYLASWNVGERATRGEVAQILSNLLVKTSFHPALNITSYGAKGDGLADNTQAIQRAIEACPAGSSIFIPAGTYTLKAPVWLRSDVSVEGAGANDTILVAPNQSDPTAILCGPNVSDASISGLTFRGPGNNSKIYGLLMEGAQGCQLTDCRFEGLYCGMKLGSGNMARGWKVDNIVARDCQVPLYIDCVSDSTFSRLDLRAAHTQGPTGMYALYVEGDCSFLTFLDCAFSGGTGWTMHFYYDYAGEYTSHDITFNDTVVDATDGDSPIVIGEGFSTIRFTNTTLKARSDTKDGDVIRFLGGKDITFDGFTATGGRVLALVDYPWRVNPTNVILQNGSFDGLYLGSGVTFQNVTVRR